MHLFKWLFYELDFVFSCKTMPSNLYMWFSEFTSHINLRNCLIECYRSSRFFLFCEEDSEASSNGQRNDLSRRNTVPWTRNFQNKLKYGAKRKFSNLWKQAGNMVEKEKELSWINKVNDKHNCGRWIHPFLMWLFQNE